MEKIQVVVAHASSEMREQMGLLVLRLARNYKCKVALSHTRFPEGSPGLVGIYGTRSKQRTRLQEGVFSTLGHISKGDLLLATRSADTQPMLLARLKVVPRYVMHCGEVMPKHLKGTEVDPAVVALQSLAAASVSAKAVSVPSARPSPSPEPKASEWGAEKYDEDYDSIDVFMSLFTKENLPFFLGVLCLIAVAAFVIAN